MKNTIKIFTAFCAILGMCAGCNNGAGSSVEKIIDGFDFNLLPSKMIFNNRDVVGGYCNPLGEMVIDIEYSDYGLVYDRLGLFHEGMAYVGYENNPGFINEKGEMVVDLSDYQRGDFPPYFCEGLVLVNRDNKSFVAIDKTGEIAWEAEGHVCTQLRGGYAMYTPHRYNDETYGVINSKGEIVIDAEGKRDLTRLAFYSFFEPSSYAHPSFFPIYHNNTLKGFIDVATGKHILEDCIPEYEATDRSPVVDYNDLVILKTSEGYGLINLKGEWVVEPQYDMLQNDGKWYVFSENGYWGWIDDKGEVMIPADIKAPNYSSIPLFGISDLCATNNGCFIDRKGEIVLETDYSVETGFIGSKCIVHVRESREKSYYSWMDKNGELVGEPLYLTERCVSGLKSLSEGRAIQYTGF